MRSGRCPKCNSTTIYSRYYGIFFSSPAALHIAFHALSGLGMGTRYVSFVCTSCGYFENYIADANKLATIAQKWTKVNPV